MTPQMMQQMQARIGQGVGSMNPRRFAMMQDRFNMGQQNNAMRSFFGNPQNAGQVASWFEQQNPATQANLMGVGQGGAVQTPWGFSVGGGNNSQFHNALLQGGINPNALNQMINYNAYNAQTPGSGPNAAVAQFSTGAGSLLGGSQYDQFMGSPGGQGYKPTSNELNQFGVTQAKTFNPGAYTGSPSYQYTGGQPAGTPGTPASTQQQPQQTPGSIAVNQLGSNLQQPNAGSWNPYAPVQMSPGTWNPGTQDWTNNVASPNIGSVATTAQPAQQQIGRRARFQ